MVERLRLDELRLGDPDRPKLQELFKAFNFTRLLADVTEEAPAEEAEELRLALQRIRAR